MSIFFLSLSIVLCGITLLVTSVFASVSIIFFNPSDPTALHANNKQVSNIMGEYGATVADVCLQSLGYGVIFPLIFFAIAGFRMIKANWPNYLITRLSILLITILALCCFLNFIPLKISGSIALGGYIGEYIYQEIRGVFAESVIPYLMGGISIIGMFLSSGLALKEWRHFFAAMCKSIAMALILIKKILRLLRSRLYSLIVKLQGDDLEDNSSSIKDEKRDFFQREDTEKKPVINEKKEALPTRKNIEVSGKSDESFELPPFELLQMPQDIPKSKKIGKDGLEQSVLDLKKVLKDFGINGQIFNVFPGPVVTLYELEPAAGTKSSRVIGLSDDISRSMSAISTRIAVIPGKNAIGIELPNAYRETVYLRNLIESEQYAASKAILPLALGKNIGGEVVIADLAKMPHLLVAGTTGSGKSVAINTMVMSLLYNHTPDDCRLVMIDPKMLELSVYEGIPHLVSPVVTDPKKAVSALKWVVREMEDRYRSMSTFGVRNIEGFNNLLKKTVAAGKKLTKQIQTGFDKETGEIIFETVEMSDKPLPYIVVIVDEMADLMLVAGKEIESLIQRLAQMARAAGIHLIMATQRPSVDVITGVIKANFPTRISFQVTSKIDSRTILGEQGAEQLLGMGDMLYMAAGGRIERVHGAFVDDKEVESVVNFLKEQSPPDYAADITEDDESGEDHGMPGLPDGENNLYRQAVSIVLKDKKVSTSYIQRSLRIGYNKAAILVEKMEKEGIISPPNHVGKREIL